MNQVLVWKTCDCYTDTIRGVLNPEEVDNGIKIKEVNLSKILSDKCNPTVEPLNPT
tara:strand:- start:1554 stop:1721 length:168 start_codon:yes stop_codon:yes gene_type:complete